jgi:hypothetical protein
MFHVFIHIAGDEFVYYFNIDIVFLLVHSILNIAHFNQGPVRHQISGYIC